VEGFLGSDHHCPNLELKSFACRLLTLVNSISFTEMLANVWETFTEGIESRDLGKLNFHVVLGEVDSILTKTPFRNDPITAQWY